MSKISASTYQKIGDILKNAEDGLVNINEGWNFPRECYVDEDFYQFEVDSIFRKQWLCVGRVDEVPNPGDFTRIDMGSEPLMMVRGRDNEIRVISPVCSHRGHLLCEGTGNTGRLFRCPFHAWTYDLEGHLIAAPSMNDTYGLKNLKKEASLPSHRVEIWNGFVFANLDPNAEPLGPTIENLTKELENYHFDEMVTMNVADMNGNPWNWKMQLETGIEPYHTAYLHGMLHDFAHVRLATFPEIDPGEGAIYHPTGFYETDAGFNITTRALLPIVETLGDKERNQAMFVTIPPNLGFAAVPEGLFYYLVMPNGPGQMNLRIGYVYPQKTLEHPRFDALFKLQQDSLVTFHEQDASACSAMQKGMTSEYRKPGRFSYQEESLYQFHQWLLKRYRATYDSYEVESVVTTV